MIAAIWRPARARAVEDRPRGLRIESPGLLLDVEEDGLGAGVGDGEGGRAEGEGGDDHVVAGLDAQPQQAEVDRGGSGGQRQGVRGPGEGADVGLETIDLRAEGRDPARRDRTGQRLDLQVGHVRLRQVERFPRQIVPSSPPEAVSGTTDRYLQPTTSRCPRGGVGLCRRRGSKGS